MKKKIVGIAIVAIVGVCAAWNINASKSNVTLSDMTLDNVEALASGEGGGECRWRSGHSSLTGWIAICDQYGVGYVCNCGDVKYY